MRLGLSCTLAAAQALLGGAVLAAENSTDAIVVTASRIPVPIAETGSSVTVIDRAQIEARQATFAVDLLQDVPGVSVSRSGGIGSQAQVRVRGAEANQLLVLIDGVEANDPAGNDEFAFEHLTSFDVDRIEIVRGPQSALWGSDALAGVVNIITRRPDGNFHAEATGETGSFGTIAGGGRIDGTLDGVHMGLSLARVDTSGTNSSRVGSEDDGYDNTTVGLNLGLRPAEHLDLELTGRYIEATKRFDGVDFVSTGLPTDSALKSDVSFGYVGAKGTLSLLDDRWTQSLRTNWTATDTRNFDSGATAGSTSADKYGAYYQSTIRLSGDQNSGMGNTLMFALDQEWQQFHQHGEATPFGNPDQDQDMRNIGYVMEILTQPWSRAFVSLSARRDDSSEFRDITTYRATAAWTPAANGARLHASFGTGQKAPTFIERFGYFPDQFVGNPDLQPEQSKGWEVGIDQGFMEGTVTAGATYFHENLTHEIAGFIFDPDDLAFTAENLPGTSERRGVELTLRSRITTALTVNGSFTYTDATEPGQLTGGTEREIRRPRNTGSITGTYSFADNRGEVNLQFAYTGGRTDHFYEVAPPYAVETVNLGAYTLSSLAASYHVTPRVTVFGHIENLLNEQYEDVYGYNTPGIGAYAGVRLSL